MAERIMARAPDPAALAEASGTASRRRTDFIVGSSPSMQRVLDMIAVAARTDIGVVIQGETGTGKELVARAIHYTGLRAARPFLTVNCGAIPENLMEDEMFGHARGAFTGAHADKKGVFEEADGGTLFLDEIGEMHPACQVKILRVLQEREVRRLGETRHRKVDVRVLAATNKDLRIEMEEKRFRGDLYHRINVLPIHVPPLRERLEDVPLLVESFVRQFNQELKSSIEGFTPRALERLKAHSWPGNVRELENRVKQTMVMARDDRIDVEALTLFAGPADGEHFPTFRAAKADFEKNYVIQALQVTNGKVAGSARLAGKDRKDFYVLMRRYQIDPDDYRN
jgi:two-component system response regulator GlrR